MKKSVPICLAALAGSLSLGAFPLEWNVNNRTGIPYEVEISRTKLEKLAGTAENCGFDITATTSAGKQKLDVTLLEGQKPGCVAVRFTVPAGTTALDCTPDTGRTVIPAAKLNLFDGVLAETSKWHVNNGGKIKASNGKIFVEAKRFGDTKVTCTVDVPAGITGTGAKLELDFKSTAKETWPCYIKVEQLDNNGKVLTESLTDPRWTSLMRPSEILTGHRETGRIHPKATKLRLFITAIGYKHIFDSYGKRVKDHSVFLPKFEISRLAVRAAEIIPFPKYNDEFFVPGVSGKPGDHAFNTSANASTKAFFFATKSQACWAEAKIITDPQEHFYPVGDGTVEAWFKPQWSRRAKRSDFTWLFTAEAAQYHGPMREGDGAKHFHPCLGFKYFPKAQKAEIYFKDYTLKTYKKKFNCDIPSKKWSHIAVQWSRTQGMQIFINGKKVLNDTSFTYTPVDLTNPEILNAKYRYLSCTNEHTPAQFSVGNARYPVRSNKIPNYGMPHYKGLVDLLRISSVCRYEKDFTPAKSFEMDKDTRALFDFNRSFDGKTSDGLKFISGSVLASIPRQDTKLEVDGKVIDYYPAEIVDSNNPFKVLDKRNYTTVPDKKDFAAARIAEQIKFKFSGSAEKNINLDAPVIMDYIEYANNGTETVIHPFVRRDSEIDPRSFGDIRNSMEIAKNSARVRTNRIFQFMLSSSDYFMSYQARFNPGSDTPAMACYDALQMLNAYCGFECGPLNSMTANMFACAGSIPAGQTGGYGHSFQQAWVDGKSNLYDLSAQMFFPSMDNETPSSLGDTELEPGIFNRVKSGGDHFIRLGTRNYHANIPAFIERVAMNIRPGESLRMWYANDGRSNTLQYNNIKRYNRLSKPYAKDVTALVHAAKAKHPVVQVDHFFPEFGNAYLKFNNAPEKFAKNFTDITSGSFCYQVNTCYPVVYGEYAAKLKSGGFAKLEISTDRGRTFRELKLDADGTARPFYQVCARREYLVRINAPLKDVENFSAMTQMMTNTRVMTCKLRKGDNKLVCSAGNNAGVDITLQYRKYAKDIEISGVTFAGATVGFERILTALDSGESKTFDVKGSSAKAAVKTSGKITASLKNGKLTVTAPGNGYRGVDTVTITDNGAEKQLIVVTCPGMELVLADKITPVKNATRGNDIQNTVNFSGSNAKIKINLASERTAGKYSIWVLNRMSADPAWTRIHIDLPQGGSTEILRHTNMSQEFYKSRFYGKNGRGKFRWDYPVDPQVPYPFQQISFIDMQKPFSNFQFRYDNPSRELTEVAAVMIMPWPEDREFNNELVRVLRGVNNNQWYVRQQNLKK